MELSTFLVWSVQLCLFSLSPLVALAVTVDSPAAHYGSFGIDLTAQDTAV